MRLQLTAPLDLAAADAPPAERRIVGGVAVPWNVTARLSNGRLVRFLPGSIDPTPERAPLLCRNHDRANPFGRVIEGTDTGAGIYARARISQVPDGDHALLLAGDGVLTGFSVGVEAIAWTEEGDEDDPVIVVSDGRWDELSLVPWAAFDDAAVDYVAASAPDPEPEPDVPEPDEPDPEDDEPMTDTLDAAAPPPHLAASTPRALNPTGMANLTLEGVGRLLSEAVQAAGGAAHAIGALRPVLDRLNASMPLNAALTDVLSTTGTSGVGGLIRPQWENEVVGLIQFGSPVVNAFLRGNLTSSPVTYPKWTTLPLVDVQATQKTQVASGPVRIDPVTIPAVTYAGGNDVSIQTIDWSSPSFIAEYFAACAEVYGRKIDAAMLATILAAATEQETTGDLAADLGAAIGTIASTGYPPDTILCAGDVFGQIWAANVGSEGGAFASVLNVDLPRPRVILAALAAAGTLIVTSSRAAKSWQNQGAPVQLRAVDVALLGVDLGVYGYFAHDTIADEAIVSIVPDITP